MRSSCERYRLFNFLPGRTAGLPFSSAPQRVKLVNAIGKQNNIQSLLYQAHEVITFFPTLLPQTVFVFSMVQYSQHTNEPRHPTTVENERVSADDNNSILKEKYDLEVQPPVEACDRHLDLAGDYPDGGLTAWLVVCGVCVSKFSIVTHNLTVILFSFLFYSGDVQHMLDVSPSIAHTP